MTNPEGNRVVGGRAEWPAEVDGWVRLLARELQRGERGRTRERLIRLLRGAIAEGRVPMGARLPASRQLAAVLGLGRNTVLAVYERLIAEGVLVGRHGAGTFVASTGNPAVVQTGPSALQLSGRGRGMAVNVDLGNLRPFVLGIPDARLFPRKAWARRVAHWGKRFPLRFDITVAGGLPELRRAAAAFLQQVRGLRCDPAQVLIVSSTTAALSLTCELLTDPGNAGWTEDPGYPIAANVLLQRGLVPRSLAVDGEGACLPADGRVPAGGIAVLTPAHQFPTGVRLSQQRAAAWLDWARTYRVALFEDDFGAEFWSGEPPAPLFAADRAGVVIHGGSFGRMLDPSLRIGYLVVPPALVDSFAIAARRFYPAPHSVEQAALADFIDEGGLARHLGMVRREYRARAAAFVDGWQGIAGDRFEIGGRGAGMHLSIALAPLLAQRISHRATQAGLTVASWSDFGHAAAATDGLALGYAPFDPEVVRAAARQLAEIVVDTAMQPAGATR